MHRRIDFNYEIATLVSLIYVWLWLIIQVKSKMYKHTWKIKITSEETTTMLSSFDLKYSLFCISLFSRPNLSRVCAILIGVGQDSKHWIKDQISYFFHTSSHADLSSQNSLQLEVIEDSTSFPTTCNEEVIAKII